uniref:Uncharacterized protein n=1 Tax=Arundo donax TaxID=35708 RepID=A0A0A8ZIV6_ARUDO
MPIVPSNYITELYGLILLSDEYMLFQEKKHHIAFHSLDKHIKLTSYASKGIKVVNLSWKKM